MPASIKEIYLDFNVMIDYFDNRNAQTVSKINELKHLTRFPYSPAHIEEIANIYRSKKIKSQEDLQMHFQYIEKNLQGITNLTENLEYLPRNDGIILQRENPLECLKRVIEDFGGTLYVEEIQKARLENKVNFSARIDNVSDIHPHLLFLDERVSKQFKEYCDKNELNNYEFKYKKNNFHHNEAIIEILFNFIEIIGFFEDSAKRYRSNIHDNTHIMYASKANIFVTRDLKTKAKAEAIYYLLGIDTKVMNRDEFLALTYD